MNIQSAPIPNSINGNPVWVPPYTSTISANFTGEPNAEKTTFEPFEVFRVLLKHRWLASIFIAIGLLCGFAYHLAHPLQYRAQAKIEISTSGAQVIHGLEIIRGPNNIRIFETARQKFLTRALAAEVVARLDLSKDNGFISDAYTFSMNRFLGNATGTEISNPDQNERISRSVRLLQKNLTASVIRNTNIILLRFKHHNRFLAAEVVNMVAQVFIAQKIAKNTEASKYAQNFIFDQVKRAKQRLHISEQALLAYAKTADITITDNKKSLFSASIIDINASISDAVRNRLSAERYAAQVNAGNAQSLPDVFNSRPIQITKQRIAELRANYQEKLSTFKPGFPEMKRLRAQIRELEKQVVLEVSTIAKSIDIQLEQAIAREAALKRELTKLEGQQSDFQDKNIQYSILQREVDSNRMQYETLIGRLNDIGVSADLNISNASILETAQPPLHPVSPNLLKNLLTTTAIFGFMAMLFIIIRELLDNRFASIEQMEEDLKIPTLARIPALNVSNSRQEIEDNSSSFSEAYRSLRTSLQFITSEKHTKSIAVTSAGIADGKTTTCYKLALGYAALGKSVLVIDADLRNPDLHKMFDMPNDVGLSNMLSNVMHSKDVLKLFRRTDYNNVTFLSAGTMPPNPVDLLASKKMALTIHYAQKKYDMIIIDCPPVLRLSDAPILSHYADTTLLVISQQSTLREAAIQTVARLRVAGGDIAGSLITGCKDEDLSTSYTYEYVSNGFNFDLRNDSEYLLEGESPQFELGARTAPLNSPRYEKSIL